MTTVPTAVLLATAPAEGGGVAADLAFAGTPLAERLATQLRGLGVRDVVMLRRPGSPDLAGDLRAIADVARRAAGGVVIAQADLVTQREALAGLLADPRIGTGVLSSLRGVGAPFAFGQRSERGRVVAAASPFHAVRAPTERFLGALKVAAADLPELVVAAERLAGICAGGVPEAWAAELERKRAGWRGEEGAEARVVAAREDAVSLLVVALARAGVTVGNSDVRELFWARPLSATAVARAEHDISGHDEDRVLLNSAVKATDGFFTTFFVSPYSKYLARWAARRGLTPNQVTSISLALGVLAAAAFATGVRWGLVAGAVLLQVAFTTDCVDGQLARFTRTFTPLGAWLDSTFDRLKEWLVFAGLAIGAAHTGGGVFALAGAALTLQTVRHAFDFSFAAAEHQSMDTAPQRPLEDPSDGTPEPRATGSSVPSAVLHDGEADVSSREARPAGLLRSWNGLNRVPGLIWLKRMVVFPIGERFAVISLTAALWSAHTTFVVLLVWGGVGMAYGLAGRALRAVAR